MIFSSARRMIFATMMTAGASLASGAVANALPIHKTVTNGTRCQPNSASQGQIEYGAFGVHNKSTTTSATVICEIPGRWVNTESAQYTTVQVVVYDRNSTADVNCTARIVAMDGNDAVSSVVLSSSGGGPGSSFQAPIATFPTLTNSTVLPVQLICTLPPAQSGAFSHITSIMIDDVVP